VKRNTFRIYEHLKSSRKALVATDGGAFQFKGSLGFILADDDANILVTCFGQPAGHDPLSFWSEICTFLAAVKFETKFIYSTMTIYYHAVRNPGANFSSTPTA
jgi:hypothetical protein